MTKIYTVLVTFSFLYLLAYYFLVYY